MKNIHNPKRYRSVSLLSLCLLLFLAACQNTTGTTSVAAAATQKTPTSVTQASPTPTPTPGLWATQPTPTPILQTTAPEPAASSSGVTNTKKPVLAFYYMWYKTSSWSLSTMSDLPVAAYNSSDDATIDRQLQEATAAGITGFISSWWGPGDPTDKNFTKLLAHSTALENTTHIHFASSIYFESDASALQGTTKIVSALRYLMATDAKDPHFFHWQGKPVFFFWDPLGNGRTLAQWATIRKLVDPNHTTIWSAEGVNINLLNVFDGIHLFSGGYWGIQNKDMNQVDQGFRAQISAYNQTHKTQKIWAAGVVPGFNDAKVPGRTNHVIVARNNGASYRTSWTGALSSNPDWITITSFNEWFEGSMIEPSVTFHDLYMNITQQYIKQWRG
jgi:Glycosyl hydrolase family 99